MAHCYAYIRVSTVKQKEKGVSLQEQRAAIARYAAANSIEIVEWFEECITAAKQGRPIFNRMLKQLKAGAADGVVIHKIDRSARNLRDWAEIGEMVDAGVLVHFANESMDLKSRGGRLSADIQAVVAADYIRNLREEILKGIRGRLREGLTPFTAPVGYQNNGKGKVKTIDQVMGPLVQEAFGLYASGRHTLHTLLADITRRGLRNRKGRPISLSGLAEILNNPFYLGLIRIKSSGETYQGKHEPLISTTLFRRVKARLTERVPTRVRAHDFIFRGLFTCSLCGRYLIGECQKGHVYYRCHAKGCPTKSFREETLEVALLNVWPPIVDTQAKQALLLEWVEYALALDGSAEVRREQLLRQQLVQLKERHTRLVDALLDGSLDKESFDIRKRVLLEEQRGLEDSLNAPDASHSDIKQFIADALELASTAQRSYLAANPLARRELVTALSSNRTVSGKYVEVEPYFPRPLLEKCIGFQSGAPSNRGTRTLKRIARELIDWARVELTKRRKGGEGEEELHAAA